MSQRSDPKLPPLYRLLRTQPDADLRGQARRHADGGIDAGTMFWSPRDDRFQAAMVLAPEEPLRVAAWAVYLGMLALGDALGSVIPPGVDVTYVWPNRINLNGGYLGTVDLDVPPAATLDTAPVWLVLSFDLAISGGVEHTAKTIDATVTNLEDEGCRGVASGDLLEALARHALTWSNRWHEDGSAPLRPLWIQRLEADPDTVDLDDTAGLIEALGCLEPQG